MCSACGSCRKIISQQNECKKKKIKNEIGMKVDHVYSRWLAVQQPTMVSNKQKSSFFWPLSSPFVRLVLRIRDIYCHCRPLYMCVRVYMIFRCIIFVIFFLRRQPDSSLIRPLVVQGQRSRRHYIYCLNRSCSAPCLCRYMYNNIKYCTRQWRRMRARIYNLYTCT